MSVAVFGGTFDPPHLAHVQMVRAARARGHEVLVVVAADPPHRGATVAPADVRLAMARAAFDDLDGVTVSDIELHRAGPSFMSDTLAQLQTAGAFGAERPVLLVGGDQALTLAHWHAPDKLLSIGDVAVVERLPANDGTQRGVLEAGPLAELRLLLHRNGAELHEWNEVVPGIAAHLIRGLVTKGHLARAASLVPPRVAEMLAGAYGAPPDVG